MRSPDSCTPFLTVGTPKLSYLAHATTPLLPPFFSHASLSILVSVSSTWIVLLSTCAVVGSLTRIYNLHSPNTNGRRAGHNHSTHHCDGAQDGRSVRSYPLPHASHHCLSTAIFSPSDFAQTDVLSLAFGVSTRTDILRFPRR